MRTVDMVARAQRQGLKARGRFGVQGRGGELAEDHFMTLAMTIILENRSKGMTCRTADTGMVCITMLLISLLIVHMTFGLAGINVFC